MSKVRIVVAIGFLVVLVGSSGAAAVLGFVWGITFNISRSSATDALITASVLTRIRDGRTDEAVRMLEVELESDFASHFAGLPTEDSLPDVWMFKRLDLGGMAFAANYLERNPRPKRDPWVQKVVSCHLTPQLPNSRSQVAAHRAAIADCYDRLR